jgi:hypothetical protein
MAAFNIPGIRGEAPGNPLQQQQELAANRKRQDDLDARARQAKLNAYEDEATQNALTAQRYALDQSYMMQGSDNPRSVRDTSMTISNGGNVSASGGASESSGSRPSVGSFGGNPAGPQIDGRYMSLVQAPTPSLNESTPGQVSLNAQSYGPQDAKAHQDAAFARLKDKSGALGQGAIQSLAAMLAGRGISGQSGTFGRGLADRVAQAVQPLADLNVAHLGEEYAAAAHAQDLGAARDNAIFQGGIAQRGQDIASQQALNSLKAQLAQLGYSGGIQQRGQDLEALYRLL